MASLATRRRSSNRSPAKKLSEPIGRRGSAVHDATAPRDAAEPATASHPLCWLGIQAADSYRYFDTIGLHCHPIPADDIAWLRSQCGHLYIDTRRKWAIIKGKRCEISLYLPYVFRIEAQQPTDAFFEYFAVREDRLYRADPALDCNFDDDVGKDRMLAIAQEHLVQPYQRKTRQYSKFSNGGLSTGRRNKGRYVTLYADKPCRIDGIAECFHIEHRTLRRHALAKIGLNHPRDLLTFNHVAFWNACTGAFFRQIDKERLGRSHSNWRHAEKRRAKANPDAFHGRRSKDHWLGSLLYRIHAINDDGEFSVEQFLRRYRQGDSDEIPSGISIQLRNTEMSEVDTLPTTTTKPKRRCTGPL
ncbi:hypothetical protein J2W51_000332 [Tardiphaga robiniae]|uniref:hypothetical protein n=1 Tax=Tardiphaga robiniae TaxID=943830 RepID=UPI0028557146|nr:hypothetical protein [Tardiphaga robiniae]MDR6657790.1 hypothetical protein [Tardiphaga robiniae]